MNPPVTIYHISYALEGIKGNSDWQDYFGPMDPGYAKSTQKGIKILNKEITIFEIEQ